MFRKAGRAGPAAVKARAKGIALAVFFAARGAAQDARRRFAGPQRIGR